MTAQLSDSEILGLHMIVNRARNVTLAEALELLIAGAQANQMDPEDADGDDGLEEQLRWQQLAIDTLDRYVTDHFDAIDEIYGAALKRALATDLVATTNVAHPAAPTPGDLTDGRMPISAALAICLQLAAGEAAAEPDEETDLKRLAVAAFAAWLAKEHGSTIDREMQAVAAPTMAEAPSCG